MTETALRLKDQLAVLPEQDRLELADFLLGTVESMSTGEEATWDAELERRWREIKNGTALGTPVEEVNARLREKYS